MASDNEEQAQKVKPAPAMTQSDKHKTNNSSAQPKNKSLIAALAFIVALGALGAASYTLFINKDLQNQLTDKNNQLSAQLEQLAQKQDKTQEQFNTRTNNAEEAQATLHTKLDDLNKKLESAMSQRLYQNQDWLLLKTRYYLELAQINAHWSQSYAATTALLQQADQLLKQFNDAKIFDIRQAIAKDIAQLQAIAPVDIAGILSQLDAAQNSINDLSIPSPESDNKVSTENPATPSSNLSVWRLRLQDSMNLLEKLVVIRRHDQNIKPLMSPLFEALLKENIQLNLQEAQWAVLNKNSFVYQLVLKQALDNLKKNFNESTQNTAALIKKLTELQHVQLTQKRPIIGSALPLLNELIEAQKAGVNQPSVKEHGGKQQ